MHVYMKFSWVKMFHLRTNLEFGLHLGVEMLEVLHAFYLADHDMKPS